MRGRTPKRPSHHAVIGNRKPPTNPDAPAGVPTCPAWLSAEAKREWRRVVPILSESGVLTLMDADTLTVYVSEFARYRAACETLATEGQTYKAGGGLIKRHPAAAVADVALRNLINIARDFGLSPLSRQRLDIKKPPAPSDRSRYFLGNTPPTLRIAP